MSGCKFRTISLDVDLFGCPALVVSNALLLSRAITCMSFTIERFHHSSYELYSVGDLAGIACIYKTATLAGAFITPEYLNLPSPHLYTAARFALWSIYGFVVGLISTGLWTIAHECGHQAFSESKFVNNSVGWVLHSA